MTTDLNCRTPDLLARWAFGFAVQGQARFDHDVGRYGRRHGAVALERQLDRALGVLPFDLKAVYAELDFQAHDPAREFRPALRRHVHAQLLDRRSSLGEDVDDVEARAGGDGAEERFHRARRGLCRPVDDMLTSGGTGVEGAIAAPRDLAARDDRTAGAGWNREFLRRSTH